MGITIHYSAELKKKDKAIIKKIIDYVENLAVKYKYEYVRLTDLKGYAEKNCYTSSNDKSHIWYSFREFNNEGEGKSEYQESQFKETDTQKKAIQNTIVIHNKVNNEYMSESFEVGFYLNPFTNKYEWRGFTKTQVFNERETLPNLKFHIFIIKVLEKIKLLFLPNLDISDEGNFFFTEEERQESIKYFQEEIKKGNKTDEKYLTEWKNKKPYDLKELIKAHTGNLKLISAIGGKLGGLGYDKANIYTPVENGDEFLIKFYNLLCKEL